MNDEKIFETAEKIRREYERQKAPQKPEGGGESEKWGYATVGWFIGFVTGWIFGDKNK